MSKGPDGYVPFFSEDEEHTSDHPYCGDIDCPYCHTDVIYHAQVTEFQPERTPSQEERRRVTSIFGISW